MDDCDMAAALARRLKAVGGGWTAEYAGLDEVNLTNAEGEKFLIRVERVEAFEADAEWGCVVAFPSAA